MAKLFGRDQTIQQIWQVLEEKSILLTAERRMGKTEVLKSLRDNYNPNSYIVIFSDLEKVSTPIEFVNTVLDDLKPYISHTEKATSLLATLHKKLGGVEVAGIVKIPETESKHWKTLVEEIITDACEHNPEKTVVCLWDEVPYMLQKIEEKSNDDNDYSAIDILDTLRALRMQLSNLRMVFTGSVGLHHVITDIKNDTLASQPVNDMYTLKLPVLALKDAMAMAKYRIVEKEKIHTAPDDSILQTISEQCDCVPFYIEKLIKRLALSDKGLTEENIKYEVKATFVSGTDEMQLEHFRTRLSQYYKGTISDANNQAVERHKVAQTLLNHLAVANIPQSINACFAAAKTAHALTHDNRSDIIELLRLLVKDHYLVRDIDGNHQFAFSLIQRWWKMAEGL